jgi:cell division protein FtsW (lipid II flippase)
MLLNVFWVDMAILWGILGGLIVLAASLKRPRKAKNAAAGLVIALLLPLLLVLLVIVMPFTIRHRKKSWKQAADKNKPGHPLETLAGRPGAIIRKYLYPDRHEGQ